MSPQSALLRLLRLDHTSISGTDIALLMRSMSEGSVSPIRGLHLDVSQNPVAKSHRKLVAAIADNLAPIQLTMRLIEFENESQYKDLILALTKNQGIKYLDYLQRMQHWRN
jgi:hypothetical protein